MILRKKNNLFAGNVDPKMLYKIRTRIFELQEPLCTIISINLQKYILKCEYPDFYLYFLNYHFIILSSFYLTITYNVYAFYEYLHQSTSTYLYYQLKAKVLKSNFHYIIYKIKKNYGFLEN